MSWLPTIGSLRAVYVTAVATLAAPVPPSIQALARAHGSAAQEIVVDTVRGRPVVTTQFPKGGGDAGAWRLLEELKLGNVMGAGPEGFGNIHDIAVDRAGRIFVMDVGSKEVRVFARDGAYVRSLARDGDGPGEIRYRDFPSRRITWRAPDQLWIGGGQQYMVVDTLGNELRRHAALSFPGFFFPGEVPRFSSVIAAGTDGSLFSVVDVTPMGSWDETEVPHHTYVVRSPVSVDHEMMPGDTLAIETLKRKIVAGGARETSVTREGNTMSVQTVQPADPRFVWTVARDGMLWLAHRSRHRFDKLTFTGDTVRTVQMGDVPPLAANEPEFVPLLAALATSPEGWLWVQREDPETEGGSTWDVLDNCGRYRATVSVPVGLWRVEVGAGGEVHGISSDDLGIDFVHRYRLQSEVGTPIEEERCSF
ncbi:MAG: hypothetical protein F4237_07180 [Gemmatimonadetes bacterium]|nr:hypothetical protein [Gemmatimonadota bacterium]MYE69813.1 hypothetical protein [Gemmatimonadota bacterium]